MGPLGMAGIETAANAILGIGNAAYNDRRQLRQQQKLSEQQLGFDIRMTDYQFQKQLQMWKDTNYSAQMEQLKRAGLNPGLIYGMGGAGGAIAGTGAAHTGAPQAPSGGGEIMGMMTNRLNLGLMQAQQELIKAQTDKTKAEADKTKGVDTTLAETQTKSLTQGINNQKAQEALTRADTALRELQTTYHQSTLQDSMDMVAHNAKRAFAEMETAQNEAYINKATRDEKIQQITTETIAAQLRNVLLQSQKDLTETQINKINTEIYATLEGVKQAWHGISIQEAQLGINKLNYELQKSRPNPMQVAGTVLEGIRTEIMRILPQNIQSLFKQGAAN